MLSLLFSNGLCQPLASRATAKPVGWLGDHSQLVSFVGRCAQVYAIAVAKCLGGNLQKNWDLTLAWS